MIAPHSAARAPVQTLLSGPASGVMGAIHVANAAGFSRIVTLDMGGTSADVSIVEGDAPYSSDSTAGDFPVIMPAVVWVYTMIFTFSALWFTHYLLSGLVQCGVCGSGCSSFRRWQKVFAPRGASPFNDSHNDPPKIARTARAQARGGRARPADHASTHGLARARLAAVAGQRPS